MTVEVLDNEGNPVFDCEKILEKWKCEYSALYNTEFDNKHYDEIMNEFCQNNGVLRENMSLDILNTDITYQEVDNLVLRAKLRKASGFDGIPAEVLRFESCIDLLYKIISHCFKNGEVINPIPKPDAKDARDPLNYRGNIPFIPLLSISYKI